MMIDGGREGVAAMEEGSRGDTVVVKSNPRMGEEADMVVAVKSNPHTEAVVKNNLLTAVEAATINRAPATAGKTNLMAAAVVKNNPPTVAEADTVVNNSNLPTAEEVEAATEPNKAMTPNNNKVVMAVDAMVTIKAEITAVVVGIKAMVGIKGMAVVVNAETMMGMVVIEPIDD